MFKQLKYTFIKYFPSISFHTIGNKQIVVLAEREIFAYGLQRCKLHHLHLWCQYTEVQSMYGGWKPCVRTTYIKHKNRDNTKLRFRFRWVGTLDWFYTSDSEFGSDKFESEGLMEVNHRKSEGWIEVDHWKSKGLMEVGHRKSEGLTEVEHRKSQGLTEVDHRKSKGLTILQD